jgi:hypothetical protein
MIFGAFPSASEILNNIGSINVGSLLTGPQRLIDKVLASGGVVYGPTRALVGEAGPEAVVPLARPLALVDPAVRALSAFAQGLTPGVQPQGIPEQRPIELTIVTPTKDPHAVALETINRLTAVGY